jgi:hypothetical protein
MVVDVSVVSTNSSYNLKLPVHALIFVIMRIVYTRNREVFTIEWLNCLIHIRKNSHRVLWHISNQYSVIPNSRNQLASNFQTNRTEENGKTGGKGKGIPVTGRGDPKGCETSRLPHFV